MIDSTINLFIEQDKETVMSLIDRDDDEDDKIGQRAEISIDQPELHFSLSLPKDIFIDMIEKAKKLFTA